MKEILFVLVCTLSMYITSAAAQSRSVETLKDGWQFRRGEEPEWNNVTIPHDWAIYGPFDRSNDLQNVKIVQNLE